MGSPRGHVGYDGEWAHPKHAGHMQVVGTP